MTQQTLRNDYPELTAATLEAVRKHNDGSFYEGFPDQEALRDPLAQPLIDVFKNAGGSARAPRPGSIQLPDAEEALVKSFASRLLHSPETVSLDLVPEDIPVLEEHKHVLDQRVRLLKMRVLTMRQAIAADSDEVLRLLTEVTEVPFDHESANSIPSHFHAASPEAQAELLEWLTDQVFRHENILLLNLAVTPHHPVPFVPPVAWWKRLIEEKPDFYRQWLDEEFLYLRTDRNMEERHEATLDGWSEPESLAAAPHLPEVLRLFGVLRDDSPVLLKSHLGENLTAEEILYGTCIHEVSDLTFSKMEFLAGWRQRLWAAHSGRAAYLAEHHPGMEDLSPAWSWNILASDAVRKDDEIDRIVEVW